VRPSEIARRLEARQVREGQWEARCPAHDDRRASLGIGTGQDGRVLLACQAGCETADVLRAARLELRDLFPEERPRRGAGGRGSIAATYDYRDEQGAMRYQVVRFDPKDFRQRTPDGVGGWEWRLNGVRRLLYRLPELLAAPDDALVFVVEGEKDVDRLAELGLVATTNAQGAGKWATVAELARAVLGSRRIVVLPDNDGPGRKHAEDIARSLSGVASSVKVLELPGLPAKGDVSDWLEAGGSAAQLLEIAASAPEWKRQRAPAQVDAADTPKILIGTDERRVADEALAAIAREGDIYHRGGELVHVVADEDARIRPMGLATLRERMAASARWLKPDAEGQKPAHPPDWAVRAVHARGEWPPLRRLLAISRTPIMRPDGTLAATAGYDAGTSTLYAPRTAFPEIPTAPSGEEVAAAVRTLCDPLADFPWRTPLDMAAAVAAILAVAGRTAIEGPLPLTAIRATTPGSGKGLLAEVIALAATGQPPKVVAAPTDDAEWTKLILSLAREGAAVVSLDNVEGALGSSPLAAALTVAELTGRVLGSTAIVSSPMRAAWLATGNGMTLRRDLARRVVLCDLDAKSEHPEDRTGWRYPNLAEHVRVAWPQLVAAALTVLRAFHLAGRPAHGKPPLGSFGAWDILVRGACVWAGIGDPDGARGRIREEGDDDRDALRGALHVWHTTFATRPVTTAEACKRADDDTELAAALGGIVRGPLTPRGLGNAMRRLRGRPSSGLCFAEGGLVEGNRRWRVVDSGGSWVPAAQEPPAQPPDVTDGDGGLSGSGGPLLESQRDFISVVGNARERVGTEPPAPPKPPAPVATTAPEGGWCPPAPGAASGWPTGEQLAEAERHGWCWDGSSRAWVAPPDYGNGPQPTLAFEVPTEAPSVRQPSQLANDPASADGPAPQPTGDGEWDAEASW
jgi:hypothetical protein